jgi:uncharacterized protein (DUF1778 family)
MAVEKSAKSERMQFRVSQEDQVLFRAVADLRHESVTEFVVESARERAERLLADRTHFALDAERWAIFQEALERPAEAKPALVELFKRPDPWTE